MTSGYTHKTSYSKFGCTLDTGNDYILGLVLYELPKNEEVEVVGLKVLYYSKKSNL